MSSPSVLPFPPHTCQESWRCLPAQTTHTGQFFILYKEQLDLMRKASSPTPQCGTQLPAPLTSAALSLIAPFLAEHSRNPLISQTSHPISHFRVCSSSHYSLEGWSYTFAHNSCNLFFETRTDTTPHSCTLPRPWRPSSPCMASAPSTCLLHSIGLLLHLRH